MTHPKSPENQNKNRAALSIYRPNLPKRKSSDDIAWGSSGKDARFLSKLGRALGKAKEQDRKLLVHMAQKMAIRYADFALSVFANRNSRRYRFFVAGE